MSDPAEMETVILEAVVVHWRNETELADLIEAWPDDADCPLTVIDNSRSLGVAQIESVIDPGRNLGFGGGVNHGIDATSAPWILVLNPDIVPMPGALDALRVACLRHPGAAAIVPALVDEDGTSQCRWQLQPLPTAFSLWLQTLSLGGDRGPRQEPKAGTAIGQPAAAALLLHRASIQRIGGFDQRFFPAWFEDVDLAKRLAAVGQQMVYAPVARFEHARGGSVSVLGYRAFIWIYYRHLHRYLRQHHGWLWAALCRWTLSWSLLARVLLLPIRRPRRATSLSAAVRGLTSAALGAASGWRYPRDLADKFAQPADEADA